MKSKALFLLAITASLAANAIAADAKKLVIIAGKPSHPAGMHEFHAGALLLQKCLADVQGLEVSVHPNHWVSDESVLETADAVVVYADGGNGHPILEKPGRKEKIAKLIERGGGLMLMHYAVQCADHGKDQGESGEVFRDWVGGAYEAGFSCNPIWEADIKKYPDHPICSGLKPFKIADEWYFSIRFREGNEGVKSVLVATPTDETRDGPYVHPKGPYPHIQDKKGEAETMMWCVERKDGGRGVGFTGGHFHKNWGDDEFRKVVLNAMLWVSRVEVPKSGVASKVRAEELGANLDKK
ncbi:ThuA domain-containing protein [Luteolibacter arcticus]|uniref:ThuA domain-containing protein n=1 Tax=Luteolibacter arcticus TaxID=1581411 RepID=A0ABT3GNG9_9BACT|nr:ThuA domain-containing protein [Luteolibacter arcticus]MCW1925010.1 ThuA domain-containing protein [Luteolibacter arcticus]